VYRTAAILLGVGLGGLVDSIVLQQLLQHHFMLSAVIPPVDVTALRFNIRWSGVYDAICWTVASAGVISFYRAARNRMPVPSTRLFVGSLLMGWGGFNLVEGLLDHEILGLHHVVEGPHALLADLLFLAIGAAAPIVFGALLVRPRRDWMARGRRRRRLTPWT
jgi:uncharacterized membrane protein